MNPPQTFPLGKLQKATKSQTLPSKAHSEPAKPCKHSNQAKPSPEKLGNPQASLLRNNVIRHSPPRFPCKTKEILPRVSAHTRQNFETSLSRSIFSNPKMQPKPQPGKTKFDRNSNLPKLANSKQIQTQKSKLLATTTKPISNPKTQAGKMAKTQNRESSKSIKRKLANLTKKPNEQSNFATHQNHSGKQRPGDKKANPKKRQSEPKTKPKRNAKAKPSARKEKLRRQTPKQSNAQRATRNARTYTRNARKEKLRKQTPKRKPWKQAKPKRKPKAKRKPREASPRISPRIRQSARIGSGINTFRTPHAKIE